MLFSKAAHPPTFFISTDPLSFFFLNHANLPTQLIFQMTKIAFTYKQASAFEGERWLVIHPQFNLNLQQHGTCWGNLVIVKVGHPNKSPVGCWKNQVNNQGILKEENQETKTQLPLGICFEKKTQGVD